MFSRSHETAKTDDISNGARCKSYSWSQSHSDLEIRIRLTNKVKYEEINVVVNRQEISVELVDDNEHSPADDIDQVSPDKVLIEGKFEHPVDTDSVYWLIDNEEASIVIYIDKAEDMWWKQLLLNEEVFEAGPKNYVVAMDHLDDGSRMMIDKLIIDQRNKLMSKDDKFSPA